MYWQEKIDLVKKEFSPAEFKDPFRNGMAIMEKIVRQFHVSSILKFLQTDDRTALIKSCVLIKTSSLKDFYNDLNKLNDGVNYWLLLINIPMGSSFKVYDCQRKALQYLLYLSSGLNKQEFYIVDKKYSWIAFIRLDKETDRAEIFKSGNGKIVFD